MLVERKDSFQQRHRRGWINIIDGKLPNLAIGLVNAHTFQTTQVCFLLFLCVARCVFLQEKFPLPLVPK